ncbi:MAG: arginine--tRNA ligase [Rickettsiales bacterium]|nr:arginine--tRNA ligase [Rickettsiales bacterium]
MTIIETLNNILQNVLQKLSYDGKNAFFQYSDRPDLSDFQTNCAMALCKILKKSPVEIAENIKKELENNNLFEKISVDGPGFINVTIKNDELCKLINNTINDDKCGYKREDKSKTVVIDFGGYNVAKEPHVGHLRSTVIGESIRKIYVFCGDNVIGDVHLGDWGLQMGMVIEGIRLKYPNAKCFQDGFNDDKITDLNITPAELTEIYRSSSAKSKEDEEFSKNVHDTTTKLQNGYKPYNVLFKYFTNISIVDLKELTEDVLKTHFDVWDGESSVADLMKIMFRNLVNQGVVKESQGAWIVDLSDMESDIPPVIVKNNTGAFMYATSDMATILNRIQRYNCDLMLYIVDSRQSLHFKQVFLACKKIGLLNEKHKAEHCPFGTMNGKDNKPFKTRSGETVKLRDLINDTIVKIEEKSTVKDKDTVTKIAVACLKFADLINYRESNYIFDLEQFTNYEGKTGAYLLYGVVRINSVLKNNDIRDLKITHVKVKEERDLLIELGKFVDVVKSTYDKKAPNYLAEYVYKLVKKFSSFYASCNINSEGDKDYKNSKLALVYVTRQYITTCLDLLGIDTVEKM